VSRRMLHSTLLLQLPILLALLLARETAASFTRRADNAVGQLELIAQGLREPSGPRQLLLLAKFSSSGAAHRDGPRWTCSDCDHVAGCVNWCGVRYSTGYRTFYYCGKQVFPCREQNGVKTLQTGHLHVCDLNCMQVFDATHATRNTNQNRGHADLCLASLCLWRRSRSPSGRRKFEMAK